MTTVPRLEWAYKLDPLGSEWMIKGRVLAVAFWPNCHNRFLIEEVRTRVGSQTFGEHFPGITYHVRDATTVTDADVRAGKQSAIVFRSDSLEPIAEYIEGKLSKGT